MVGPEEPGAPGAITGGVGGVDADSDGRRETVVVTGLAAPTIVVDVDQDGCGDVMIEVSATGDSRATALTEVGSGWLCAKEPSVTLDSGVPHLPDLDPYPNSVENAFEPYPRDDADPVDLVGCLLDLFS
jgi:hypothetical protein